MGLEVKNSLMDKKIDALEAQSIKHQIIIDELQNQIQTLRIERENKNPNPTTEQDGHK